MLDSNPFVNFRNGVGGTQTHRPGTTPAAAFGPPRPLLDSSPLAFVDPAAILGLPSAAGAAGRDQSHGRLPGTAPVRPPDILALPGSRDEHPPAPLPPSPAELLGRRKPPRPSAADEEEEDEEPKWRDSGPPVGGPAVPPLALPHVQKVHASQLKKIELLGRGSFGEVWLCSWMGTHVAAKYLLQHRPDPKMFQEVEMLQHLTHPAVIRLLGVCTDPAIILTQYYQRGSVYSCLRKARHGDAIKRKKLNWMCSLQMLEDVASGMMFLHSTTPPTLHGDLRTPNILLETSYRARIGDFGLAKVMQDSAGEPVSKTTNPRWLAPEVYRTNKLTKEGDVYSFGIIMLEMLTWGEPYEDMNDAQVAMSLSSDPPLCPEVPLLSLPPDRHYIFLDKFTALMRSCWQAPHQRPTFAVLRTKLAVMRRWALLAQEVPHLKFVRQSSILSYWRRLLDQSREQRERAAAMPGAPAKDLSSWSTLSSSEISPVSTHAPHNMSPRLHLNSSSSNPMSWPLPLPGASDSNTSLDFAPPTPTGRPARMWQGRRRSPPSSPGGARHSRTPTGQGRPSGGYPDVQEALDWQTLGSPYSPGEKERERHEDFMNLGQLLESLLGSDSRSGNSHSRGMEDRNAGMDGGRDGCGTGGQDEMDQAGGSGNVDGGMLRWQQADWEGSACGGEGAPLEVGMHVQLPSFDSQGDFHASSGAGPDASPRWDGQRESAPGGPTHAPSDRQRDLDRNVPLPWNARVDASQDRHQTWGQHNMQNQNSTQNLSPRWGAGDVGSSSRAAGLGDPPGPSQPVWDEGHLPTHASPTFPGPNMAAPVDSQASGPPTAAAPQHIHVQYASPQVRRLAARVLSDMMRGGGEELEELVEYAAGGGGETMRQRALLVLCQLIELDGIDGQVGAVQQGMLKAGVIPACCSTLQQLDQCPPSAAAVSSPLACCLALLHRLWAVADLEQQAAAIRVLLSMVTLPQEVAAAKGRGILQAAGMQLLLLLQLQNAASPLRRLLLLEKGVNTVLQLLCGLAPASTAEGEPGLEGQALQLLSHWSQDVELAAALFARVTELLQGEKGKLTPTTAARLKRLAQAVTQTTSGEQGLQPLRDTAAPATLPTPLSGPPALTPLQPSPAVLGPHGAPPWYPTIPFLGHPQMVPPTASSSLPYTPLQERPTLPPPPLLGDATPGAGVSTFGGAAKPFPPVPDGRPSGACTGSCFSSPSPQSVVEGNELLWGATIMELPRGRPTFNGFASRIDHLDVQPGPGPTPTHPDERALRWGRHLDGSATMPSPAHPAAWPSPFAGTPDAGGAPATRSSATYLPQHAASWPVAGEQPPWPLFSQAANADEVGMMYPRWLADQGVPDSFPLPYSQQSWPYMPQEHGMPQGTPHEMAYRPFGLHDGYLDEDSGQESGQSHLVQDYWQALEEAGAFSAPAVSHTNALQQPHTDQAAFMAAPPVPASAPNMHPLQSAASNTPKCDGTGSAASVRAAGSSGPALTPAGSQRPPAVGAPERDVRYTADAHESAVVPHVAPVLPDGAGQRGPQPGAGWGESMDGKDRDKSLAQATQKDAVPSSSAMSSVSSDTYDSSEAERLVLLQQHNLASGMGDGAGQPALAAAVAWQSHRPGKSGKAVMKCRVPWFGKK